MKARTVENIFIGVLIAQFAVTEIASPTEFTPWWIAVYVLLIAIIFIDRWNRRRKGKPDRVRTVEDWCSIGLLFLGVTALWGYRQIIRHYPPFAATETGALFMLLGMCALSISEHYREKERQALLQSVALHSPT